MSIMSILNSATPLYPKDISGGKGLNEDQAKAFGQNLSRRIAENSGLGKTETGTVEQTAENGSDQEQGKKLDQLRQLEEALGATVNYMTDKYGKDAGTAMIGLVYKSLGGDDINEDTLGKAFLEVTRFIDRNFGIEEGDAFMEHLNGSLNDSLNGFFENGLNEQFMAVTTYIGGSGAHLAQDALAEADGQYVQDILDMLEKARANNTVEPDKTGPYSPYKEKMSGILQDSLI